MDEPHQRDRADEPIARDHEEVGQVLGGLQERPDSSQRVGDRGVVGNRDELGAHEAARRLRVEPQDGPHLALLGLGKQLQHRPSALLVELHQEVGGVVGGHVAEHRGHLLV